MNENHEPFMRKAIEQAKLSVAHGNRPFGAILVRDGEVILTAENTSLTENDVTCHAELNLIRLASKTLPSEALGHCTLYASAEPCGMCSSAAYWAGIGRVVFGCPSEKLGQIIGFGLKLHSKDVFEKGERPTEVIGPILETEAMEIHHTYWKSLA